MFSKINPFPGFGGGFGTEVVIIRMYHKQLTLIACVEFACCLPEHTDACLSLRDLAPDDNTIECKAKTPTGINF